MSRTIDERIVNMKFNNADFEKNAQQSISTLDKLKQSLKLDESAKSFSQLDKAAKNVDLSAISKGVEALEKRFSAFGIASMRVIENLTDSAMNFAKNTMGAVLGQISTGGKRRAFNIENARFQLQGLLGDEKEVQAVMDNAMDSVDGTAYGYDEAAKAASMFAATGMRAGDQMYSSLLAIAGVSAMTNAEYSSISQIFTTVAGQGKVMADQLNQLATRGLNAAATIKDFFNNVNNGSVDASDSVKAAIQELTEGLEITEADIRDFVSDGEISFEMFAEAMSSSFGEHAKKANDTVNGSMANVRAALSRIGALFYSPLIEQKGPLVQFFNTLKDRINEIKKYIEPFATSFTTFLNDVLKIGKSILENLNLSPIKDFFESLTKTFDNLDAKLGKFSSIGEKIGKATKPIDKLKESVKDLSTEAARSEKFDLMKKSLKDTAENSKDAKVQIDGVEHSVEEVQAAIDIWTKGIYGNGEARKKALEEAGLEYQNVQDIVNKIADGTLNYRDAMALVKGEISDTTEETKNLASVTEQEVQAAWDIWTKGTYGNGEERIRALQEAGLDPERVQAMVNEIAAGTFDYEAAMEAARQAAAETAKETEKIEKNTDSATYLTSRYESVLKNILDGLGNIKDAAGNIVKFATQILGAVTEAVAIVAKLHPRDLSHDFKSVTERIKNFTANLKLSEEQVRTIRNTVRDVLKRALITVNNLKTAVGNVFGFFRKIFSAGAKAFAEVFNLGSAPTKAADIVMNISRHIKNLTEHLKLSDEQVNKIKEVFKKFFTVIENGKESLSVLIDEIGTRAKPILDDFISRIEPFKESAWLGLKSLFEYVKGVAANGNINSIGDALTYVWDAIKKLPETGAEKIEKLFTMLTGETKSFEEIKAQFKTSVDAMVAGIRESLGNLDMDAIFSGVKTGAGLFILFQIVRGITSISNALKNVSDLPKKLVKILDEVSDTLQAYQNSLNAEAIYKVAKSIGILALSIVGLSLVPEDKLRSVASSLGAVMFALAAVLAAKGKLAAIKNAKTTNPLDPLKSFFTAMGEAAKKAAKLFGTAAVFLSVAGSIAILAGVAKMIYDNFQDKTRLVIALGAVVVLGSVLAVLAGLVNKFAKELNVSQAIGLVGIALAVRLLADPMEQLALLAEKSSAWNLVAAVGAIGIMLLVCGFIGKLTAEASMIKSGVGLVLIAYAIKVLAGTVDDLAQIASVNAEGLMNAVIALGVILAMLSLLVGVTGAMTDADTVGALFGLTGVILGLAAALYVIGTNIDASKDALWILALALAAVVAAGAISGIAPVTAGLYALTGAVVAMGLAAALVGVGILAFAAGLAIAAQSLGPLADAMIEFAQKIVENGALIIEAAVVIVEALATAIIENAPLLAKAVLTLILVIAETISDGMIGLAEVAIQALIHLLEGIDKAFWENIDPLMDSIQQILRDMLYIIVVGLLDILEVVAELIFAKIPGLRDQITGWIDGAKDDIRDSLQSDEVNKALDEKFDEAKSTINHKGAEASEAAGEQAKGISEIFNLNMDLSSGTERETNNVVEELKNGEGRMAKQARSNAKAVNKGYEEELDVKTPTENSMQGALDSILSQYGNFGDAGSNLSSITSSSYLDGLSIEQLTNGELGDTHSMYQSFLPILGTDGSDLSAEVLSGMMQHDGEFPILAGDQSYSYADALQAAGIDAYNSGYGLSNEALNGLAANEGNFWTMGWNAAIGYHNGIAAVQNQVAEMAGTIANTALDVVAAVQQSFSPARKFIKLGEYAGEGYVIGMENQVGDAANAAEELAQAPMDAMGDALSTVAQIVDNDLDLDPTIRPVVDLTDLQNGLVSAQGLINGIDGYGASINAARAASRSFTMAQNQRLYAKQVEADQLNKILAANADRELITPINNTFNITGDNPREIAQEVSRIIQTQVERKEAVWA